MNNKRFNAQLLSTVALAALTGIIATGLPERADAAQSTADLQRQMDQLRHSFEQQMQQLQGQMTQLEAREAAAQAHAAHAEAVAAAATQPPAAAAVPPGDTPLSYNKKDGIQLGGITLKPGGYISLDSVWRPKNLVTDPSTTFTNNVPYPSTTLAHEHEFRATARATRASMLATGKLSSVATATGFVEADFYGVGTTSNANNSNSYVPRMRQGWVGYARSDWGLHVFGGQMFSLTTPSKKGLLPGNENGFITIDQGNTPGYATVRQPGLRIVKDITPQISAALSLENPATPAITAATGGGATINVNNPGAGALNATATYSTEAAPDIVAKLADDTSFGHFEIAGIARFLHAQTTLGSSTQGHTEPAGGVHVAALIPLAPKWEMRLDGLMGYGVARYDTADIADAAVSATGRIQAVPYISAMTGLFWHATPSNDVYGYAGYAQADRTSFGNSAGGFGAYAGGSTAATFACMQTNGAGCNAITHRLWAATLGDWQKIYQGEKGTVQVGINGYLYRVDAFSNLGIMPHAVNEELLFSFRYTPFQ